MVRTQIYLTERERAGLDKATLATGKKQSELIREALDRFLEHAEESWRDDVLKESAGLWEHRKDLPDFAAIRRTCDRG